MTALEAVDAAPSMALEAVEAAPAAPLEAVDVLVTDASGKPVASRRMVVR